MQQPESQQEKVAVGSRFLSKANLEARVSRFLARHPKVSRFVSLHIPVLCPFLPLPTGVHCLRPTSLQSTPPAAQISPPALTPQPRPSRFLL